MARRIIIRKVLCSKNAEANVLACDTLMTSLTCHYKERS
jgi:hypothetical protein